MTYNFVEIRCRSWLDDAKSNFQEGGQAQIRRYQLQDTNFNYQAKKSGEQRWCVHIYPQRRPMVNPETGHLVRTCLRFRIWPPSMTRSLRRLELCHQEGSHSLALQGTLRRVEAMMEELTWLPTTLTNSLSSKNHALFWFSGFGRTASTLMNLAAFRDCHWSIILLGPLMTLSLSQVSMQGEGCQHCNLRAKGWLDGVCIFTVITPKKTYISSLLFGSGSNAVTSPANLACRRIDQKLIMRCIELVTDQQNLSSCSG